MNKTISNKIIILTIFSFIVNIAFCQTSEIDSLKKLLHEYPIEDTTRINLLNETAYKLYKNDIQQTLIYAEEALKIADVLNYSKGKAESLRIIGIYYDLKAEYTKALEYYQRSLKISKETNYEVGISKGYHNIGIVYKLLGDYPKALDYYHKSLAIDEKYGNKLDISKSYMVIGNIYYKQYSLIKAKEYYLKALKVSEEINHKEEMSIGYLNLGGVFISQANYTKAKELYQKALEIKKEIADQRGVSVCYSNIGSVYSDQKDYPKAIENYQKALKIAIESGNKSMETSILIGLGNIYLKQNKIQEAYNYSKRAYVIALDIKETLKIKNSSKILAKSCNALGLYKEAYDYHVIFKSASDSLFNENNIKKITALEYQYEYNKQKSIDSVAHANEIHIKDLELQKKQQENKYQKTVIHSIIGGVILLLIFLAMYLKTKHSLYSNEKKRLLQQIELLKQKAISTMIIADNKNHQFKLDKSKIEAALNQNLNETDWKILNIIFDEPTLSNQEIADKVSLSLEGTSSSLRKMYRIANIRNSGNKKLALVIEVTKICSDYQ